MTEKVTTSITSYYLLQYTSVSFLWWLSSLHIFGTRDHGAPAQTPMNLCHLHQIL